MYDDDILICGDTYLTESIFQTHSKEEKYFNRPPGNGVRENGRNRHEKR